jgi:site-specific DNA-methyltransferase (adenine-specific)
MYTIHNRDCLAVLAEMETNSVDLVATDPPYYRVKADAWDNQWGSPAEFIDWLETVVIECVRVLKPTGSLYLFMGPKMAASVERMIAKHMVVENHIVWIKPSGMHKRQRRASLRRYFPATERIIFATQREYSEAKAQHKAISVACSPIINYLRKALNDAGLTQSEVDRALGSQMAGHWFGRSQWRLPTEEQYGQLQKLFKGTLNRRYQSVKAQYNRLVNHAQKPVKRHFDVDGRDWYTDAWVCQPVQFYPGKHPCEKPMAMMEHIITASSRPGDLVFDPFMGSGTTGVAAIQNGRRFMGCELGEGIFTSAEARLRGD